MHQLHTMIVGEEAPTRQQLATMLAKEHRVRIVAQCANRLDALAAIDRLVPDLLFLDIAARGRDSLELLASIHPRRLPHVVFVTAHSEPVARALQAHGLEQLTKPVDSDRLHGVVDRVVKRCMDVAQDNYRQRLARALRELSPQQETSDGLPVRTKRFRKTAS